MALTAKTWRLNSYTPGDYTDLIVATGAPVVVKSLIITETAGSAPTVRIRTTNSSGVEQSAIIAGESISANASYTIDLQMLVLGTGEKLQVSSSLAGTSFTASGVQ